MEQNKKLASLWFYLNNLQDALNKTRETQERLRDIDSARLVTYRFKLGEINFFLDEIEKALKNAETCLKEF